MHCVVDGRLDTLRFEILSLCEINPKLLWRIRQRQQYLKACISGLRVHVNIAAVLSHDTLNRIETQAGAFSYSLGGKERFEDMRLYIRRDAGTVVGDFDYYAAIVAVRADT